MGFPKITLPQIIAAVLGATGPVLILFGADLNPEQLGAVDDLKLIAASLFGADAIVRLGRNIGHRTNPPPKAQ